MPSRITHPSHSANGSISALQDPNSAVNTILSGRKCWRILKGRNEPVWPPPLEAALIEGLQKYKPTGSRSTKALGRLPMRNKFVSDYIFEITGKRRTPKQVGSRIQQLRDTNSGKHIVKVLSDQHYDMLRPARSVSDEDVINEMTCMTERPATEYIEIPVSPPQDEPHPSDSRNNCPRPLRDINPAATFVSETKVECWSLFNVFQNDILVATETYKTGVSTCPIGRRFIWECQIYLQHHSRPQLLA
ncbi:hypothetical protein QCA50_021211 [Cerrena zonata]|uniref:TEA domain-containing protein n=1 Tax=Cerrena zonata TaxID=2478898 RepID=A0AAW0FA80_9APHY